MRCRLGQLLEAPNHTFNRRCLLVTSTYVLLKRKQTAYAVVGLYQVTAFGAISFDGQTGEVQTGVQFSADKTGSKPSASYKPSAGQQTVNKVGFFDRLTIVVGTGGSQSSTPDSEATPSASDTADPVVSRSFASALISMGVSLCNL
jgi:hypothetical protein